MRSRFVAAASTLALTFPIAACSNQTSSPAAPETPDAHAASEAPKDAGPVNLGADLPGALMDQASPPTPDDCIKIVTPGLQKLNCEGLDFNLSVPDVCTTKQCGFITDVHGFGMTGDLMETHTHMQEIAGAKGYIVVQPSAPGQILASSWAPSNDDQVYKIMQRVINVWHVDSKRVHFDGYSMGAWMTWRFVCNHSDLLASAAPIAGGLQPDQSCTFTGTEIPARKIPVLYTHGREDGLVKFSQALEERDAVLAAWYPGVAPTVVAKADDYEWDRYTDGAGGVFEFVQHDWACSFKLGGLELKGHCFPGSDQFLGCGRVESDGGKEYPFKWAETVLQFFLNHPSP